ncbi:hypothetical protein PVA44_06485 [Entomospira nematocerorum]|uniref:Uncharacterized protein n=1 Tax=Entomospira nematocerorum TaxID=2719987 RepID=A0A968GC21_9SPIO|nr:hypothetical protein [Entomospira nematocera]NIZ46332.1 hypothetical protein [Entomospira nematocera]WDI33864.1 hypothetical protein PVA44_06485 [Entomospira nematocera]
MRTYQRWRPLSKRLPKLISEDSIPLIPQKMLKQNLLVRMENRKSHRLLGEHQLIPFPPMSITDSHVYAYSIDWNIWIVKHIPQTSSHIDHKEPYYTLSWERYYYNHIDYCLSFDQKWIEYPIVVSCYTKKRKLIQSIILDIDVEHSCVEDVSLSSRGYTVIMTVKLPSEWFTYISQSDRLKIKPFERDALWALNLQSVNTQYWLKVLSLLQQSPHWIGDNT